MASFDPGHAVYVHWPFCAAKCPYCDFNSHVRHGGVDEPSFTTAVTRELTFQREMSVGDTVDSIFFGGGTPSLMSPGAVARILNAITSLWPVATDVEITLEANPSSVEAGRFAGYRAAGVNRVSLGVQALNDPDLKALGRLHNLAEAKVALATAFRIFDRVSFDLIYARPSQTPAGWRQELGEALSLGTTHLSLYQLTIEEGTPFAALHAAGKLVTPPEMQAAALYEITQELTQAAGLPAYEVSNHARPGQECRHNLVYWRYGTYAGAGAGAHGRLATADGRRIATSTERSPERWRDLVSRQGHGMTVCEQLTPAEQADEMLLMGLRIGEGIPLARLEALLEHDIDMSRLGPLIDEGLLTLAHGQLRATATGRPVLNRLVLEVAEALSAVPGARSQAQARSIRTW